MVICFWMEKTYTAKSPLGDFKVSTHENPLLSQQAVTSKGISIPYTNLQLNTYPNTQFPIGLVLYWQFLLFNVRLLVHNEPIRCTDPSTWLTTNLRRMLAAKFFSLSTRRRSQISLVTKPYDVQTQQLLEEIDELGHISLVHKMLVKNFCI